jgi:hypothetical protein
MNTDQVSPVVQRHVTESICDARLAVQHLIDEVRAAFGEMVSSGVQSGPRIGAQKGPPFLSMNCLCGFLLW